MRVKDLNHTVLNFLNKFQKEALLELMERFDLLCHKLVR